jgi:hypothetical protein
MTNTTDDAVDARKRFAASDKEYCSSLPHGGLSQVQGKIVNGASLSMTWSDRMGSLAALRLLTTHVPEAIGVFR